MGVHFSRAIQNPRAVGGDVYYVYDPCKSLWKQGRKLLLTRNVLRIYRGQFWVGLDATVIRHLRVVVLRDSRLMYLLAA